MEKHCDSCGETFNSLTRYRLHGCASDSSATTSRLAYPPLEDASHEELVAALPDKVTPQRLPDRCLKHQETLDMWDEIDSVLAFMPQSTTFDKQAPTISCAMIATTKVVAIIAYTAEDGWDIPEIEPKPADVFEAQAITNKDYSHPTIERLMDTMESYSDSASGETSETLSKEPNE
jgi:hypothetical protein